MTITVTLYTQKENKNTASVIEMLERVRKDIPHQLVEIDVDCEPALKEKYQFLVPVLEVGPYRLQHPFAEADIRVVLGAARDRSTQLTAVDGDRYLRQLADGHRVTQADRVSLWLSRYYMLVINFFLAAYLGMAFLAPVLMKAGYDAPARLLYTAFSPMCHQLPFRSWFLFGEQTYYPREMAEISGVIPYETVQPEADPDLLMARNILGDDQMGYKVALCQRDVAIYGSLLLFGMAFFAFGRHWKSLPWYVWVVIGILPIGMDGGSQLTSLLPGLANLGLARESTPLLRSITGALFGLTTAWYMFPLIEESMLETRRIVTRKMAVQDQLHSSSK